MSSGCSDSRRCRRNAANSGRSITTNLLTIELGRCCLDCALSVMPIVERWRSTDHRHRRKPWDRCRGVAAAGAAATLGGPGMYVHYAAAKAAVDTLPVGLSKEVAAQ